jgi:predicted HicB family RNase H-like nuclease
VVDGATWSRHYGSSVRVVEGAPERGLRDGEQGEDSSSGGGQQRQKDSVEQVVKDIKAEQQVEGVPASDEELGQLNHRLASELLEAILGGAAAQQDGAGEGHPQASCQQQQQEDQGVYRGVEEATGMVSAAPASSIDINNAEPVSTSSWDFNSLGLDLGMDLSVDMNLDLDLNVDQLIHDDSGCSTPLGESADGDAAEQDVDDAVWRGLVDSSLLQVY